MALVTFALVACGGSGGGGASGSAPTLTIDNVNVAIVEGNTGTKTAEVTVSLSSALDGVSVKYATSNGTASASTDSAVGDYTTTSGTLNFTASSTTQTIKVPIVGDTLVEANETFTITLSNPTKATLGASAAATVTITNDDEPTLTIADITVTEGNTGTKTAEITVSLSSALNNPVSVKYATSDGTAIASTDSAVGDYNTTSGTLNFTASSATQTISVPITGDTEVEVDETFTITLSEPTKATLGTSVTATVTITNDDTPTLTIADISINEGNTGTSTAEITVSSDSALNNPVTVKYATSNGTASAGSDYTVTNGTLNFTDSSTTQTITVPIAGDTAIEEDETFTITLSEPNKAQLGSKSTATVTITNDDAALTITDVAVVEGDTGTKTAEVTVSLSSYTNPVTVAFATSNGTAIASTDSAVGDYTTTNGTLNFNASGAQTIRVPITVDTAVEEDETFTITLSNPTQAKLGSKSTATVTITNDDFPVLTIANVSIAEGNTGTKMAEVTVTSSNALSGVSVDYATSNGTASASTDSAVGDYTTTSGTLNFTASSTTQTISVPIVGDTAVEGDETFTITLSNPTKATLGTSAAATVTITNDDETTLTISDVSVTEGNTGTSTAEVTVLLNSDLKAVNVNYATSDGTASAGSDYTATIGTLVFAAGSTTQTITVPIAGDTVVEGDETFTMTLSEPTNASLGSKSTATVTITNDDAALSITDMAVVEGDTGTKMVEVTVSLSSFTNPARVKYATSDGTASAESDYTATSGFLNFSASGSQTIRVPIAGDTVVEEDETFTITLSEPTHATLGADPAATVTITNDDKPTLTIDNVNVSVDEGNTGTKMAEVTVSSSNALSGVRVDYATSSGTGSGAATAGDDYTATNGTLNFTASSTTQTISVPIVGDTAIEGNETFTITLSNPIKATLGSSTAATVTITNDDKPTVTIGDVSVSTTEGNTGTSTAEITVSLNSALNNPVTVKYATSNGTASSVTDYTAASGTLTFTDSSTTQTITLSITGDTEVELDETFTLTLSNPTKATLGTNTTATVTITNDDTPTLTIADISIAEGDTGTSTAEITVSSDSALYNPVTVKYATSNGTATASTDSAVGDYTNTSGTLNFTASSTTQTISVPIVGDTAVEENETFMITLSDPNKAKLGSKSTATVTINNDDTPTLTIADISIDEGNTGTSTAVVTVSSDSALNNPVTVKYATSNGTGSGAASAGSDYTTTNGTLTFTASSTTQTISVPIVGDTAVEGNETFTITLSEPNKAKLGSKSTATVTINDDDDPPLTIGSVAVVEGNTGTSTAEVTVSLSNYTNPASVKYATSDGTASAGSDYTATNGTLNFTGGNTTQTISVSITGDASLEADETFTITLSEPTNATLGTNATATVTITNDDYALNDTGVVKGGGYTTGIGIYATCTSNGSINADQDCNQGRDSTHNDNSDGHAGFSFTKLDSNGNNLAASATSWSCVKDNVTGLVWEVKTDANKDVTYKWGGVGADSFNSSEAAGTNRYDDWTAFVNSMNTSSLCGFTDWRVPHVNELESLLNLNQEPTIDQGYFPRTRTANQYYWSSTAALEVYQHNAWAVQFSRGRSVAWPRENGYPVRLVRGIRQ